MLLLSVALPLAAGADTKPGTADPLSAGYFSASPQLADPLQPFRGLAPSPTTQFRAAVATVPDPLETPLARAFDIEVAALISAFQVRGYVLDGFAFAWQKSSDDTSSGSSKNERARDRPSVLLFRCDAWRSAKACKTADGDAQTGADYFAVFLVGETPTWGVHPRAFQRAARCAAALDREPLAAQCSDWHERDCDELPVPPVGAHLDVIGPAFSGSMESVAQALVHAFPGGRSAPEIVVDLRSPSATVKSNESITKHPLVVARPDLKVTYSPVAPSLPEQMRVLLDHFRGPTDDADDPGRVCHVPVAHANVAHAKRVVLLAEESNFGDGAVAASQTTDGSGKSQGTPIKVIPVRFPPNIAAIRAEHASLDRDANAERRTLVPSRLLELDLGGVGRRTDRPPVYQPKLTSRSDELLLYRTFDALKTYVHPVAVVIVATDVRDRLFLVREVRDALPDAQPVVLEQDNLLVHPDYRDVDRGTLVVPAGNTLVMLDEKDDLIDKRTDRTRYVSFATDYAANTFRAGILLLSQKDMKTETPSLLVSTLSGFQNVEDGRSTLVAADPRVQLQLPLYLGLAAIGLVALVLAGRLREDPGGGSVSQSLWRTITRPWEGQRKDRNGDDPAQTESMLRPQPGGLRLLAGCGTAILVIALFRTARIWYCRQPGQFDVCSLDEAFSLAHGRDAYAFVSLFLVVACASLVAWLRTEIWNRRCREYEVDAEARVLSKEARGSGQVLASGSSLALFGVLWLILATPPPQGVDWPIASALTTFAVLAAGSFFLVVSWMQLARWQRISRAFLRTIGTVRREGDLEKWPSPELLEEKPTNPFHLTVHDADLAALRACDAKKWIQTTTQLMEGVWFGVADGFTAWQRRLVAEMKVASVAVRTNAWCAVLAPAVALAMMQIYPPGSEHLEALASVTLLALGFASMIRGSLQLERDPLLGRMFTRDEDRLTPTRMLGVVWPKLLGFGTLLAAAFLPDVWSWLHRIVQAFGLFGQWAG